MAHELARILERPIGRGGGQREGRGRTTYVAFAVTPAVKAAAIKEASGRGLALGSLAGAIFEAAMVLSEDALDDLLAGSPAFDGK